MKKVTLVFTTIVILTVFYFHPVILGGKVFQAGDANASVTADRHKKFSANHLFYYNDTYFIGQKGSVLSLQLNHLASSFLPPQAAHAVGYIVPFILFFVFLYILSYEISKQFFISVILAAAGTFSPVLTTFIMPGHAGKIQSIAWIPLAFYFLYKYLNPDKPSENLSPKEQTGRPASSSAAGKIISIQTINLFLGALCLGTAFLHGATQTVLYFAVIFTAFYFFFLSNRISEYIHISFYKKHFKKIILFVTVPLLALIMSWEVISKQWNFAVAGERMDQLPTIEESQKENKGWNWATQWSFPPAETIDLFTASVFGKLTGDRKAPYFGAVGRSHNWSLENKKNGYANFSMTSHYLGLTLFFLALTGAIFVRKRTVTFWIVATAVALLLSWGRFFPLYRLFYELPLMDKFRNPNKFLHVVHFSVFMLAVYGGTFLYETCQKALSRVKHNFQDPLFIKHRKLFKITWLSISTLTLISIIVILIIQEPVYRYLYRFFGNSGMADNAYGNIIGSLGLFLFLFILTGALFLLIFYNKIKTISLRNTIFSFLLLFTVWDGHRINKSYIRFTAYENYVYKDQLVDFLKTRFNEEPFRVKLLTKNNYLDHFLDRLIPAFGLQTSDYMAARSFPPDYRTFFKKVSFMKQLQFFNVKYLLANRPVQVGSRPVFQFQPPSSRQPVYCYPYPPALNKAVLVNRYTVKSNMNNIFSTLNNPSFNPGSEVLFLKNHPFLKPENGLINTETSDQTPLPNAGTAEITHYSPVEIKIDAKTKTGAVLIVADRFEPTWHAEINGEKAEIVRANYLTRGIYIPKGEHSVILKYRPDLSGFYASAAGWLLFVLLLGIYKKKETAIN